MQSISLKSFPKKSILYTIERLLMPRIALRSQDLLIFVFSFFCSFAVRLPFWRAILAYRLRARLSSSAAAATPQLQAPSRRFFAERATTWTAEIIILDQRDDQLGRAGWGTTSRTRQDDERSRHAGRYWRFVQVVRRPGRRRLQKHDHRWPDTDHRPERPRVREEGF